MQRVVVSLVVGVLVFWHTVIDFFLHVAWHSVILFFHSHNIAMSALGIPWPDLSFWAAMLGLH